MKEYSFKLYHYPATRSARVKWMLHEVLGEDFEVEVVPLYEGVQYEEEYLTKNPNHCVPTLEITHRNGDKKFMVESGAMVVLLADAFPEKELAPVASELSFARADFLQMVHFGTSSMDMMLWQIRIHKHVLLDEDKDPKTLERYLNKFKTEVEPQLISRLESGGYICGDQFSAADCIIGHDLLWARSYGLCQDDLLNAYLGRLAERKAFQQAFADAHLFKPVPDHDSPVIQKFTG